MANLRNLDTLNNLRWVNTEIRRVTEKMNNLLEDNMSLFTKDELLDNLEMLKSNVEKLSELSEMQDSPFISDSELINAYTGFSNLITTEYLALKSTVLEKQVKEKENGFEDIEKIAEEAFNMH